MFKLIPARPFLDAYIARCMARPASSAPRRSQRVPLLRSVLFSASAVSGRGIEMML